MSEWQIYNKGFYLPVKLDSETDLALDFQNELTTGDYLTTATFSTTDTGIVIAKQALRFDAAQGFTNPHQAQCTVQSSTIGTYAIKLTTTTNQGFTHVKHFDVRIER
tara:strand:- start:378 stop:698 length:321 start_codon:yes stop_codon:yes gene_type:complete